MHQMQEKEDMWQERDSECHRTKLTESEVAAFVDKCSKIAERHCYACLWHSRCRKDLLQLLAGTCGLTQAESLSKLLFVVKRFVPFAEGRVAGRKPVYTYADKTLTGRLI